MHQRHECSSEDACEKVLVRKLDVKSKKTLTTPWTADVFANAMVVLAAREGEDLIVSRLSFRWFPGQDLQVQISFLYLLLIE